MKKVLVIVMLSLLLAGALIPGSTALIPSEPCCTDGWVYDEYNETWSIDFSGQINASFIKTFGILWKSKVGVIFSHEYSFSNGSRGYIETSYNRGDTWTVVEVFNDSTSPVRDIFITLTTDSLWVRFTVESTGGKGYWRVWGIGKIGDSKGTAPDSTISLMESDLKNGWFTTSVNIQINSFDRFCGVNEIRYILYGKENIVYNAQTNVMIEKNGINKLVYWAVDRCGNEEIPNIFCCFKIDTGEPTIKIIRPEPGLYLFGKKMNLPTDKLIFIGGFDIEVTPQDNTSGIDKTIFYLDGNVYAEAIRKPYRASCNVKHGGKGTITVYAEDFAGNTAKDNLDIVYYNFL